MVIGKLKPVFKTKLVMVFVETRDYQ